MKRKNQFWWRAYFILAATIFISNLISIFHPDSDIYVYYHTLMVFHKNFTLSYYLNIASAVLNFLSLIVLLLYIFPRPFLSARIWQIFFLLRMVFDICGHTYENKFFKSLFYTDLTLGAASIALLIMIIFPSYFATFRYAFRQDQIFRT